MLLKIGWEEQGTQPPLLAMTRSSGVVSVVSSKQSVVGGGWWLLGGEWRLWFLVVGW